MMRRHGAAFVLVWALVPISSTWAESGDEANRVEAERHFTSAMRLVQREQWTEALAAFETSMQLFPTQTTAFNRALCLRLLGRAPEAIVAFEELIDRYETDIERRRQIEIQRELANLRPAVGRIEVRTGEIRGALVLVDGSEAGRTPLPRPLAVNPGAHRVEVRADGFENFNQQITVAGGDEQALDVSLQRAAAPGRVRVNLALPGAQVAIDGRQVGTSPLAEPVSVSPGQRTISASRPGYQTAQVQVQVIEGDEVAAELTMVPLPNLPPELTGALDVQVGEPGAEVLLDGSPLRSETVPVGPHHIEVRLEGFETFTQNFEVGHGATTTIEAELQPMAGHEPDSTDSRRGARLAAYVLTGLAVVALGAGIGLAAWNGGRFDDWETEDEALRLAYSMSDTESQDPDGLWERTRTNNDLSDSIGSVDGAAWFLLVTGITSAVTAVVLYIVGFRSSSNSDDETQVSLLPGPGGLTLGW